MEAFHNPLKFGETLDANGLQGEKTESCQVSLEEKENFVTHLVGHTIKTCGSWPRSITPALLNPLFRA